MKEDPMQVTAVDATNLPAMFRGRTLLVATKHKKEDAIAQILEEALGVRCVVADALDTDLLGTFTGERERQDDPLTTARKKCHLAMEHYQCDLAVSSEGSFGPHPTVFFVPADDEWLLLIDKQHELEISAREISTETNFSGMEVRTRDELLSFAEKVKFPSHGLIIRKAQDDLTAMVRGISTYDALQDAFQAIMSAHGKAYVETDMRAMFNPTRMKVIGMAAQKLAEKIKRVCPVCATPGFDVSGVQAGLPCELCHFPTRSTLSHTYTCARCAHTETMPYPNGKQTEDPMYCDLCNP